MNQPSAMERRVSAAQATLDRFKDKPFSFGTHDCARMVAFHLRQLGYQPMLSKGGSYKTCLGAKRALRRAGYPDLAAAIDRLGLVRIAPAEALPGDILQLPAVDELGALTVALSNGRVLGYHESVAGAVVMQPSAFSGAWRVAV